MGFACVCVCVNMALCVRFECVWVSPGERASDEWFKHWQELKRNAIYKL